MRPVLLHLHFLILLQNLPGHHRKKLLRSSEFIVKAVPSRRWSLVTSCLRSVDWIAALYRDATQIHAVAGATGCC